LRLIETCSASVARALRAGLLAFALLAPVAAGAQGAAGSLADPAHPLQPIPTASPRDTLQGFLAATDALYQLRTDNFNSLGESGRLFLDADERAAEKTVLAILPRAVGALDISQFSPALKDTLGPESVVMLREVLDRIDLPAVAEIPGGEDMKRLGLKKWRIPDSEIDIVLIEEGPQAGQYLVSAETLRRLPEFYARVRNLPDKSPVSLALMQAMRKITADQTGTIYDAFLNSPAGLMHILPARWLLNMPDWAKTGAFGLAVWQWFGLGLGFALAALLILASVKLKRLWKRARRNPDGPRYHSLLIPLTVIFVAGAVLPGVFALLRIGGETRVVLSYAVTLARFIATAWLALVAGGLFGEAIVSSERIRTRSLDGQLFRLGGRLLGMIGAIGVLIRGADALGLPAYSVVAGLGVGGLTVALASRDAAANLLGSIFIMFEKPFRIGHLVQLSGHIGTVENVGFRSTRIRTLDNSLISIPNNAVVNATVENLTARPERRQKFFVQVTYNTPREKLDALLDGIRTLIEQRPFADSSNFHVRFNGFGESSLDILVIVHLLTNDYGEEMAYREDILLGIMDLAAGLGVSFAFPTRTLQWDGPAMGRPAAAAAGAGDQASVQP
jgi:MscS family membrane protein